MLITGRPFAYPNTDEVVGGSDVTQAPSEDTPAPGAQTPEDQSTVNWEERYKHLQADHTRAAQEAAEYRKLVEGARQGDPAAIEALGLVFADQEDTEPDPTAGEEYLTKAEWEQYQQAQQQERQQEQRIAELEAFTEATLDKLGYENEKVREWIFSRAIALPPDEEGRPNIQAAHEQYLELIADEKKSWANSKRAPHVSQVGQAATQNPDLDTHKGRVDYMLGRLAGQ